MRRIDFQRLRARNFKAYRDVKFDFQRLGPGCHSIRGVNLVQPRLGSNGAGKSTLWDALAFGLTGRTTKRLRAGDVQSYGSDADPVVIVEMEINGTPYVIERHAVPHRLTINGEAALQERLDELTGIDLDLLLQTVILAQGTPLYLDLEPRFKMALLSDALKLDRFDAYSKQAGDAVVRLNGQASRFTMRKEKLVGSIAEVGRQMNILRTQSEDWQTEKRDTLSELSLKVSIHARQLRGAETRVQKAHEASGAAKQAVSKARDALVRSEDGRDQGVRLNKQIDTFTGGRGTCPTCRQAVGLEAIATLRRQADKLIADSRYDSTLSSFTKANATALHAQKEVTDALAAHRDFAMTHSAAEASLAAAQVQENPFTKQMHALKDRLNEIHREERTVTAELGQIEREQACLTPWVSGFKDIRLMVLDDTLRSLSVLTTSYAAELGLACQVRFAIDRQTKSGATVTGINCIVDAVEKFESWSGGEAQRLRLAASLALSSTLLVEAGVTVNLLALDEPSAHLSTEGLEDLVTFLSEHAASENRAIYVTDQRPLRVESGVLLERNADNVEVK